MNHNLHFPLALASASIIAFQLALIQVFSLVQWHHFAYMVIAIALLGFGASGAAIAVIPALRTKPLLIPGCLLLSGVAMAFAVPLTQLDPLRFDSYRVFIEQSHQLSLLLTYIVLMVPFFCGAMAIGLIFVIHVDRIGSLYFANLLGSGIGALIPLVLMWSVHPAQLPALVALPAIIAGVLLLPRKASIVAGVLAAGMLFLLTSFQPSIHLSEYKNISRTLNLPDAKVTLERNSPHGLIQVVTSPALRYAPGLSLAFRDSVPAQTAVFCNGNWFGPAFSWSRSHTKHMLDFTTLTLPYAIRQPTRVLVLQAGTGWNVAHALTHNVVDVTAVEPNVAAVSVMLNEFASQTDSLFFQSAVHLVRRDARSYLLSGTSRFDLIVLPMLDAFGGTSGLYALQEQYSLTSESFKNMWDRLTPEGMICISSWMDYPFRNPLKALATIVDMMDKQGITELAHHIAAIRSWGTITFVVSRTPWNNEQVRSTRDFCRALMFDPAILPSLQPGERTRFNGMSDDSFFQYVDRILSPDRSSFYGEYDFNIASATDDRPFFSQFLKWKSLPALKETFGSAAVPFLEIGYLIAVVTLVQLSVVSFVLILAPLFKLGFRGENKLRALIYFGGLGVGFMFVEMVLIQKFVLYFGLPVYAMAAVLACMLVCAGLGSLASTKLSESSWWKRNLILIIVALIAVYAWTLSWALQPTIGSGIGIKILVASVLIGALAFVMGFPFPLGLRSLAKKTDALTPWAWGINGCASVVSPALAMVVAVEAGFTLVMLIAGGAYLVAWIASLRQ